MKEVERVRISINKNKLNKINGLKDKYSIDNSLSTIINDLLDVFISSERDKEKNSIFKIKKKYYKK